MPATDADRLHSDYAALTERCGLFDRSERGKLALTGSGAVEFLNGQVTAELADLRPGEGRYAAFLTHKGKMLGDLRVLAVVDELLLDTERVALQALFDMIRRYSIGYEVELHKRTLESSLLSLIGPDARACVARARGAPKTTLATELPPAASPARAPGRPPPEVEHAHLAAEISGVPVRLVATADGIDLLFEAPALDAVRAALLDAGASPVEEQAAEVLRVERGIPRYGLDIDDSVIPQEADLNERAVSFTKGCYVGQETVARLYYKGKPNRLLRGLRLSSPASPGEELRLGERAVGILGSVADSPRFGPIALALVRREAAPGDTVAVGDDGTVAVVCGLPFS
jgi:tRNA-modifying protein YgfZ